MNTNTQTKPKSDDVISKDDEPQLSMKLDKPRFEFWYKIKYKFSQYEQRFEYLPFWRYWINAFALVSMLVIFLGVNFVIYVFWNDLPAEMPLFYYHPDANWELYPKYVLFFIPGIIFLIQVAIFQISFKMFASDDRLSIIINVILVLGSILYMIAIGQLFALVLI